ncbi:MAG TPA: glycosyltransferase family A protein [Candidatus Methylomirabilis sp.]|nr:glycosyltransferase family A protein [Candidatus Methylomirabilis sp.]
MTAASASVIIPVYNGERYLEAAIASVLAQTVPAGEILVVDDGSTDRSAEVARSFGPRVRCAVEPHRGLPGTLNRGVDLAGGSYLAFLDADDLWTADKLERQTEALAANPRLDAVFAHVEQFLSPELDSRASALPALRETGPGYLAGTMLIRTEAFRRVGPFDLRWQIGNFGEWYLRARDAGIEHLMLPQVLLHRRLHRDNMGIRERASRGDYARILKDVLDRRRQARGTAVDPPLGPGGAST